MDFFFFFFFKGEPKCNIGNRIWQVQGIVWYNKMLAVNNRVNV